LKWLNFNDRSWLRQLNGSKNIASDVFTSAPYIEQEMRR